MVTPFPRKDSFLSPFSIIFLPERQICDTLLMKPCQTLLKEKHPRKGREKGTTPKGQSPGKPNSPKTRDELFHFQKTWWPIGNFFHRKNNNHNWSMAPWAILGDSPNRVSWLVLNVCFEPGKQCGQYSANVHYGMTLHRSQLEFFAIDGHVKNPGSTIYIHFQDTNLSKYTQILQFE